MNISNLVAILCSELDGEQDGDRVTLPSASRITIMVSFGDDVLPVHRVRSVRVSDEVVHIEGESDSFWVAAASAFALKASDSRRTEDGRPGFH